MEPTDVNTVSNRMLSALMPSLASLLLMKSFFLQAEKQSNTAANMGKINLYI